MRGTAITNMWCLVREVVPIAALFTALAAALAGWLRSARGVRAPYTRKIFHFIILSAALVVQLRWGFAGTIVYGSVVAAGVLLAVARGAGNPFYEALARDTDAPHRTLFILIPLATTALGGMLANALFPAWAHVGYMVVGWGDAVGEPVGTAHGRHRYRVPSLAGVAATRSLEGSAAVLVASVAAAAIALLASGISPAAAAGVALAVAAGSTLVEAASNHGLDNFTIQLAASGIAAALL
jgi:phytol kinase